MSCFPRKKPGIRGACPRFFFIFYFPARSSIRAIADRFSPGFEQNLNWKLRNMCFDFGDCPPRHRLSCQRGSFWRFRTPVSQEPSLGNKSFNPKVAFWLPTRFHHSSLKTPSNPKSRFGVGAGVVSFGGFTSTQVKCLVTSHATHWMIHPRAPSGLATLVD